MLTRGSGKNGVRWKEYGQSSLRFNMYYLSSNLRSNGGDLKNNTFLCFFFFSLVVASLISLSNLFNNGLQLMQFNEVAVT